jgi:hypothetical protein
VLFFRFCGCFSCSREVSRTRRNLKLALNSFENDLHSESYSRKINVKKISKNLYEMANSCVEFRKNSRFSSIFFKIHNFGTHIFLYVYTTHTQLPHMSYSGFQIHNTCYTHVKSCVYIRVWLGTSTVPYSTVQLAKNTLKIRKYRDRYSTVRHS